MPLTVEEIAKATRSPLAAVKQIWPLVLAALDEFKINTDLVQVAAAATIAIETARTFQSIHERGGDAYLNRMYDTGAAAIRLGNTPEADGDGARMAGDGLIQITGLSNRLYFGQLLGVDLVNKPENAREPTIAARILAAYFAKRGVATAANAKNWIKTRIRVNGINRATGLPNGWQEYDQCVGALLAVIGE